MIHILEMQMFKPMETVGIHAEEPQCMKESSVKKSVFK